jgi:hypothetical protein
MSRSDNKSKLRPIMSMILVITGLWGFGSSFAGAQSNCKIDNTLFVSDIHGKVFDPHGVPIPNATVHLEQGTPPPIETRTDANGKFHVRYGYGWYTITVKSPGFQDVSIPVKAGPDMRADFHSSELKVILGLHLGEHCIPATTSNRVFHLMIESNNKNIKGNEQQNATQK